MGHLSKRWIESAGGPLILVPGSALHLWRGYDRPDLDSPDPTHDYGRACQVCGYLRSIPVGDATGPALGDEPNATTIEWHVTGLLIIVRWIAAEDESSILRAAREFDIRSTPIEQIDWNVFDSDAILFDAAVAGADAAKYGSLMIRFSASRYCVDTFWHNVGGARLGLHVFRPVL